MYKSAGRVIPFFLSLLVLWGAHQGAGQAQVPQLLNYQGYLTSPSGTPINATVTMVFKLYDAPGPVAALYSETQSVTVTGGIYDVAIGSVTPLTLPFNVPYYLGVTAGGDAEMTPRRAVTSSPYALQAANALGLGGLPPSRYVATDASGNVGIGPGSPLTRLALAGGPAWTSSGWTGSLSLQNAAAIGWESNASGQQFGIGQSGGGLYFFSTNSAFATTASPANYKMIIADSGRVGIGTINPTKARVEIANGGNTQSGVAAGWRYSSTGPYQYNSSVADASLYATSYVLAFEFAAFSDERIKHIDGRSDPARDLATLAGIEVTDYTYIDAATRGAGKHKKVIGQQVEKVFPQAVRRSTDVVPDIYKKAGIKDGWVVLATNLKKGERVRLIGMKNEGIHEVLEVAQGRFRTDFNTEGGEVFVYGREVKDFRNVDYEAIAMLNVSATQELNRRLELQAAEIAALKQQLTRMAQLEEQTAIMAQAVKWLGGPLEVARLAASR